MISLPYANANSLQAAFDHSWCKLLCPTLAWHALKYILPACTQFSAHRYAHQHNVVYICKRLHEWHFYEVQNKFYLHSFRNFIMAVHVHLYTFTLHTTWTASLSKCALTANLLLHTRNESCSMLPHLLLRFSTVFSCTDDGTDCDSSQKHCCRKNDKDASVADFFISSSID